MIQILYFGWVRSRIGTSVETMELADGVHDIASLVEHLRGRGGGYAHAFDDAAAIRAAVNQEIVPPDTSVGDGDEIAFFPPMTGG